MKNNSKEIWEQFDKDWFNPSCNYKKRIIAAMVCIAEKWEELDYATDFFHLTEIGFYKGERKVTLFSKKYVKILENAIREDTFYTLKKKRENNFYDAVEANCLTFNFNQYKHPYHKAGWLFLELRERQVIIQDENEFIDIAEVFGIKKNTASKVWKERMYPLEISYTDIKNYGESIITIIKEND